MKKTYEKAVAAKREMLASITAIILKPISGKQAD